MANLSAQILRNLVSSVFGVPAREVHLSGEISPDWEGTFTSGISYMDHSEIGEKNIWGFNPHTGFTPVTGAINYISMYNGNHDRCETGSVPLHKCITGEELFFVVESSIDTQSTFTIYKAPDFQEHWRKIEQDDVARWAEWLCS